MNTHGPGYVHPARALCPGRSHSAVSWGALGRIVAVSQACTGHVVAHGRRVAASGLAVSQAPWSRYIICIVTQALAARHVARAASLVAKPCRARMRPITALLLAVLRPKGSPPVTIQELYRDLVLCRAGCR